MIRLFIFLYHSPSKQGPVSRAPLSVADSCLVNNSQEIVVTPQFHQSALTLPLADRSCLALDAPASYGLFGICENFEALGFLQVYKSIEDTLLKRIGLFGVSSRVVFA